MFRPSITIVMLASVFLFAAVMFTHSQPLMPTSVDGQASSDNTTTTTTTSNNQDMVYIPMPVPFNLTALNGTRMQSMFTNLANNTYLVTNMTNSTLGQTYRVYFNEGVLRPFSFFVGQNIRLLGQGLWSFGHQLKHSGYAIANLEAYLNNASVSLTNYGYGLVNQSISNLEPSNVTMSP